MIGSLLQHARTSGQWPASFTAPLSNPSAPTCTLHAECHHRENAPLRISSVLHLIVDAAVIVLFLLRMQPDARLPCYTLSLCCAQRQVLYLVFSVQWSEDLAEQRGCIHHDDSPEFCHDILARSRLILHRDQRHRHAYRKYQSIVQSPDWRSTRLGKSRLIRKGLAQTSWAVRILTKSHQDAGKARAAEGTNAGDSFLP